MAGTRYDSLSIVEDARSGSANPEISTFHMRSLLKSLLPYLVATAVSVLIVTSLLRLWKSNLRIPLDFGGDAYTNQMLVKNLAEGRNFYVNPSLGAPGQQELYDFPLPHWTHLIGWSVLRLFTRDYGILINLYYLLSYPLSALTALYAFRRFKISAGLAVTGAVLFSFLPLHLQRSEYDLFLSSYYVVPLAAMVAVWIAMGNPLFGFELPADARPRPAITQDGLIASVSCVLIGWDNPYYAFFAATLLLVAGLLGTFRHRHRKALFAAAIVCAVLTGALFIALLPNLLYFQREGRTLVAHRSPSDSETYGLTLIQLLAPVSGHGLPVLSHWKAFYDTQAILVNDETKTATLGAIGAAGFLVSLASLFRRRSPAFLYTLGILNLWAVLLGTIGGFGTIFAFLISPQLRSYNRISVFIGFFSIAALLWALDRILRSRLQSLAFMGLIVIPASLLIIGILDQIPRHRLPDRPSVEQRFHEEDAFIATIEKSVPPYSMIFQLPYVPFPEYGPVNEMVDYDHLVGYLHSKTLRWSYGAMKYRETDRWLSKVSAQPIDQLVASIAAADFAGIYIDRFGYSDHAAALEAQLRALLKSEPVTDASGRYFFVQLDPQRLTSAQRPSGRVR